MEEIDICRFLKPWSDQLVNLSFFEFPKSFYDNSQEAFWNSLNQMPSLIRLNLMNSSPGCKLPDNFSLMYQLKQFALVNYGGDLYPILSKISCNFENLILHCVYFNTELLEQLITENPIIATSIKGIDLSLLFCNQMNRVENYSKIFQFMCDRLTEINFLDIMFGEHVSKH